MDPPDFSPTLPRSTVFTALFSRAPDLSLKDWILLSTRFELHLLIHSFKRDLDDADRPSS